MDLKASFDQVYKHKLWTDNGKYTLSGPGSEIECAKNIIKFLIDFIKENNIKRIIDGSCGDCMWIMKVLNEFPDVEYIVYDISQEIININKEKYSKYSFYQQNLLELKELPTCDLFIIRHTMMHLSLKDNIILIDMLKKNSNCFIALTHHEVNKNNDEKMYKKYEQLVALGFTNVYVYVGGMFEWLLLQDIYGSELFPTTSEELDILKYKSQRIFDVKYISNG